MSADPDTSEYIRNQINGTLASRITFFLINNFISNWNGDTNFLNN